MKVYKSLTELVGKTPLLEIGFPGEKTFGKVYAKLEYFNPLGSVKDRTALSIVNAAEREGKLKSGGTIIEATSGNTGIGLAFIAASKGYHLILTMPESMSLERRKLLSALGAVLVLTPASEGMSGAVARAEEMHKNTPNSIIADQFKNPANTQAHFHGTAVELYSDMDGKIDAFISGIGTGGTFTGCMEYLKNKIPGIYGVAVEPYDSQVIKTGKAGSHKIQGIGANFVPYILNEKLIDEIYPIRYDDAAWACRMLAKNYGLLVGISSGAAAFTALQVAKRVEFADKNVVCVLPDSGERYMSTGLFD